MLIRDRILEPDIDKTYKTLQKLIAGELITKDIEDNFVFADFETDKDLLWTLLTYSGYLTQVNNIESETYQLKIPNYEIKGIKNQQENETYDELAERINNKIDEVLEQIERKKYYKELLAHKIQFDKIKRVPIIFAGKEPYITKIEKPV